MLHKCEFIFISTLIFSLNLLAAKMEVSDCAVNFIKAAKSSTINKDIDLNSPQVLQKGKSGGAAIGYEIIRMSKDDALMNSLAATINCTVVYDSIRGRYIGYNHEVEKVPLADVGEQNLATLKKMADNALAAILKEKAVEFEFSNNEMDSSMTAGETNPRLAAMSYRYTRELNGRHIVDNTAFIRVTFCGNNRIGGFEMADPTLKPFFISTIVKESVSEDRLEQYVKNKKDAEKFGAKFPVSGIKAEKGFFTYLAMPQGNKMCLIPHVSFYTTHNLDNGDNYKKWVHLNLDGSTTPNIDPGMIEDFKARNKK
jgi:hypothetical protein